MVLGEQRFSRGEVVPSKVLGKIPVLRFNALVRVGHLKEVDESALGEMCPQCGKGPFTRLARHVTAVHEDHLVYENAEIVVEVQAVEGNASGDEEE